MKVFVLLTILITIFCSCYSQNNFEEWAPKGANWLYWKPNFSNFHECVRIAHDRDTVINNHLYKVFDVYDLLVVYLIDSGGRKEDLLYSYYIGLIGDTVFTFCSQQKKESYYIDRDKLGEKFYLFRDCNPLDTVWKRLDTVYYSTIGGTTNGLRFKFRVYSSNVEFSPTYLSNGTVMKNFKDTVVEFMPFKTGTFAAHYGINFNYHKGLKYKPSEACFCSVLVKSSIRSPEVFECYYDPNFGSYTFYGGQCWLRNAYMSSLTTNNMSNFSVSPNPAYSHINIKMSKLGNYFCIIYDQTGKLILSKHIREVEELDISHLLPATYVLTIQKNSEVIGIKKIIKN